ncbi:MAG: hypothetical protein JO112_09465 [Planctomycetes bacterium]|nr:hypothetical protein [Planctomycetota bacterium]
MSLNEAVLRKAVEWKPVDRERQSFLASDEETGWAVQLTVDRNDAWGCLVWELALRRSNPPQENVGAALRAWAVEASLATGLLDPLKVLEVDLARNEALLRSAQPTRRGQGTFYYEILLKGAGEALVRRYQGYPAEGKPRQQVAFPLTHEALAKVVAELAGEPV